MGGKEEDTLKSGTGVSDVENRKRGWTSRKDARKQRYENENAMSGKPEKDPNTNLTKGRGNLQRKKR